MLLIGFNPIAVSRACSHNGDGWTRTFSNTSALNRGHNARSSISIFTGAAGRRQTLERNRIAQILPRDRGHLARHPVMAPKIRPMRDALVVDLDDAVGRRNLAAPQFENPSMIAIDPELGGARQHAVALNARNHLHAQRNINSAESRPAIRRTAHHDLSAVPIGIHNSLHVVAALNRLHAFHHRRYRVRQQRAHGFHALALGGLHRDQALQRLRRHIQAIHKSANPVVGEFQNCLRNRRSPLCSHRISSIA